MLRAQNSLQTTGDFRLADQEHSLITDEHRAMVGVKSEPTTVMVNEVDAHRMRDILGDTDPRYANGTGLAAPYTIAMFHGGRRTMGVQVLPGGLLTQQEWKFTRPLRIGEELTAISQVFDVRERLGGRYGYSVLVTNGTDYYDSDGNHVAAAMMTITQFDPKAAR
jgi:acyl dehydratase